MISNREVIKDLLQSPPKCEKSKFVFFVDNEALERAILLTKHIAIGIENKEQGEFFISVLEECQYIWANDYYYVLCSSNVALDEVKKVMEKFGFVVLLQRELFKGKESYYILNPEKVGLVIDTYIAQALGQSSSNAILPVCATDLMAMDMDPIGWIVEGMIPTGLAMLVGAAKIGKSWLALQLCIGVASGKSVLGYDTKCCNVLYLALEDTPRRLKNRMVIQLEGESPPKRLYILTEALSIKDGLLNQLETYVKDYDIKLVVIDTLQKILDSKNTKNAYGVDYDDMGALKKFADLNEISIVAVHHTRKMPDDDVYNTISGTTGLMGAADTILVLKCDKRNEKRAILNVTGRDVISDAIAVEFSGNCAWDSLGSVEEVNKQLAVKQYRNDPVVQTIIELVTVSGKWEGTAAEFVAEITKQGKPCIDVSVVGRRFRALQQQLADYDHINYQAPKGSTAKRIHKFSRI